MTEQKIVAECWTCPWLINLDRMGLRTEHPPSTMHTAAEADKHRAAGHDVRPVGVRRAR
jgi:hypothetical protein